MQPFSRETITDRRQPFIRWTAVIAGALVALGSWMLLQLLFTGGTLSAIDENHIDKMGSYGIGTSVGSILAPLLALFAGGLTASRLAAYFDKKVSAFHGVLVWAITSIIGLALLGSIVSSLAANPATVAHADMAVPPDGANEFVDSSLDTVNARMKAANAPTVAKSDFLAAARFATNGRSAPDRTAFINRLDDKTSLSRPEAEAFYDSLGTDAPNLLTAANQLAAHRERALAAAQDAGKGMLAAGVGLLLCLLSAIGGALVGSKLLERRGGPGTRTDVTRTDTTYTTAPTAHTTAQYPTVTNP